GPGPAGAGPGRTGDACAVGGGGWGGGGGGAGVVPATSSYVRAGAAFKSITGAREARTAVDVVGSRTRPRWGGEHIRDRGAFLGEAPKRQRGSGLRWVAGRARVARPTPPGGQTKASSAPIGPWQEPRWASHAPRPRIVPGGGRSRGVRKSGSAEVDGHRRAGRDDGAGRRILGD